MSESEPRPSGDQPPKIKFAAAHPSAIEYGPESTRVEFTIQGNDQAMVDGMRSFLEGNGERPLSEPRRSSGKSHAMPGKNWRASWQPQGPKPNSSWQRPREN